MKKFLTVALAVWFLTMSVAFAEAYYEPPRFLNGDQNYLNVGGITRLHFYLNTGSIKVTVNDPPYHIITAEVLYVHYNDLRQNATGKIGEQHKFIFFYDEDEVDMRAKDGIDADWKFVSPHDDVEPELFIGEAVFYISQGRKFYGDYSWMYWETLDRLVEHKPTYWNAFNDSFYEKLR